MLERTGEVDYRYRELFTASKYLLSLSPEKPPSFKPAQVWAKSFEELFSERESFARLEKFIRRTPKGNEEYKRFREEIGDVTGFIINKFFGGIDLGELDRRVVFAPVDFPSDLPEGVEHYNYWHLREDIPTSWLADSVAEFMISKNGASCDFLVWRKPMNEGEYTPGLSRSIPIPHGHLLVKTK